MMNDRLTEMNRREFVRLNAVTGAGFLAVPSVAQVELPLQLSLDKLLNNLQRESTEAPIEHAVWYRAEKPGDGLLYTFSKGRLGEGRFLTFDALLDGMHLAVFRMTLQEGEGGPAFHLRYAALNQCSFRVRFPLGALDLNRWRLEREGAWLKPTCSGQRVDPAKVDRLTIAILHKSHQPVRWCQTPLTLTLKEPDKLDKPLLPKGPLLDELGQSTIHRWPSKTKNPAELTQRLNLQSKTEQNLSWPDHFSHWGGWRGKKIEGTGFFTVHHDGRRWWLADPAGHPFWSTGLDCVRPGITANCGGLESALTWKPDGQDLSRINYLSANFIRAFGEERWMEHWSKIVLSLMRDFGFNTVANWSQWEIARQAKFPYVRPLSVRFPNTKSIYRDFPDVFHSNFLDDAKRFGEQLRVTLGDPAMIGYFLMNEPTWGFSWESPAAGMLFNTPSCETRKALAAFLRKRYSDNDALSKAWGITTSLDRIAEGTWTARLTDAAKKDLYDFSEIMVETFFKTLSNACKAVDPDHLNLGIRYQGVPPKWTVKGMRSFDVFSMNCYRSRVPLDTCKEIHEKLKMPVLIGEWHFGALDVGLPAPGLCQVRTQADRGKAYRYYLEDAAANPYCVGVHYFTLYDQSAMGRFDGENYNIGFLDVCNRPYKPFADSARESHNRVYDIAAGILKPFDDAPEYLPRLF